MEVDPHPESSSGTTTTVVGGTLKRSTSAPMINVLVDNEPETPVSLPPTRSSLSDTCRVRRLSYSSLNLHAQPPPTTSLQPLVKGTYRIHQIKREESAIVDREAQHERDVQSAMQMSTTLDDFNLDEPMGHDTRRPRSFSESLHIFTSPTMLCSSPSPTRVGKQCFSPSMQMPVRNNSFSPSPSPSPTRKSFHTHRSLSPISVRPSILGKRKMEDADIYTPSSKRFSFGGHTPDRLLTCLVHPLANSISSGSQGDESSPERIARRSSSLDIDHTDKLTCFGFTPVRESTEMNTDSETSDIAELADISDSSGSNVHSGPPVIINPPTIAFSPTKQTHLH